MREIFFEAPASYFDEPTEDHIELTKAFRNHVPIWIRIDDPFSNRNGSIGLVTTGYLGGLALNSKYLTQRLFRSQSNLYTKPNNPVSFELASNNFTWLQDYTGTYKHVFTKKPQQVEECGTDMFGTPLRVGSFVAASNGKGMIVGNIKQFSIRRERCRNILAEINVVPMDSQPNSVKGNIRVNLRNLMVITDTIKTQALLAKLEA